MFTAQILDVYGSGAPFHEFFHCTARVNHRSPKRAMELARQQANSQDGAELSPIYSHHQLFRNGTLVMNKEW